MSKLDDLIAQKTYELNCLRSYRAIIGSGDCNSCKYHNNCDIEPKLGQMVRYNCYRYIMNIKSKE